jgi:hypothetical protein
MAMEEVKKTCRVSNFTDIKQLIFSDKFGSKTKIKIKILDLSQHK